MVVLRHLRALFLRNLKIDAILRLKRFDQIFFALSFPTSTDSPLGYVYISEYILLHSNPSWEDLNFSTYSLSIQTRKSVLISVFACRSTSSENVLLLELHIKFSDLYPIGTIIPENLSSFVVGNENLPIFLIGEKYYMPTWKLVLPLVSLFNNEEASEVPYKESYHLPTLLKLINNSQRILLSRREINECTHKLEQISSSSSLQHTSSTWSTTLSRVRHLQERRTIIRKRIQTKQTCMESLEEPDENQISVSLQVVEEHIESLQNHVKQLKTRVIDVQSSYATRRRILINQLLIIFPLYDPNNKNNPSTPLYQEWPTLGQYSSPVISTSPPIERANNSQSNPLISTYTQLVLDDVPAICGVPSYDLLSVNISQLDKTSLLHVNVSTAYICHLLTLISQVLDLPLRFPLVQPSSKLTNGIPVWSVRDSLGITQMLNEFGSVNAIDYGNVGNGRNSGGSSSFTTMKEFPFYLKNSTDERSIQCAMFLFNSNIWAILRFFGLQTNRFSLSVTNLFHLFLKRFPPVSFASLTEFNSKSISQTIVSPIHYKPSNELPSIDKKLGTMTSRSSLPHFYSSHGNIQNDSSLFHTS